MKGAAIYLRVSTQDQTTSNQEHELRQAAQRAGWQVVKVYKDHGISGAKGRKQRTARKVACAEKLAALCRTTHPVGLNVLFLICREGGT